MPRVLWNSKVHYRIQTVDHLSPSSPSPNSSIPRLHGTCTWTTSTLQSSKMAPFIRYPHQSPACVVLLSHACRIPRPSHALWLEHPNEILQGVQIIKLFLVQFSPASCYFLPLRTKISSSAPRSRTTSAHGLPLTWETKSHNHKKDIITIIYYAVWRHAR